MIPAVPFSNLFGAAPEIGKGWRIALPSGLPLYVAWAIGDQRFRAG
ncbi:hypothetical protein [Phenylobacterium sp.]